MKHENETAQPAPVGQVERGVRPGAEALHAAVCQAVALLNRAPEVARCAEGREARDLLRQALVAYADAYMDEPATERERASVAAKHQRKPRVSTAAELRQQAKSDTSCASTTGRSGMSNVPLPSPDFVYGQKCADPQGFRLIDYYIQDTVRRYGDARAAEARRLAVLEAAELCQAKYNEVRDAECKPGCDSHGHDEDCYYAYPEEGLLDCAKRLRALADEPQPSAT